MLMRSNEPVIARSDVLQIRFNMKNEYGETIHCCVPYSALDALKRGEAMPPSIFDKHRAAIEAVASRKHERGETADGRIALGTEDMIAIRGMA